jgi:hypothetical protein
MLPVAHVGVETSGVETSLCLEAVQIAHSLKVKVSLCPTRIFLIGASTMNHENFYSDRFLHIKPFKQLLQKVKLLIDIVPPAAATILIEI